MLDRNNLDFNNFLYKEIERQRASGSSADKLLNNIMLLVSTGAFGLSINFFINNSIIIKYPAVIKISWICLSFSILFDALGYFLSRRQSDKNVIFFYERIVDKSNIFTPEEYTKHSQEDDNSCTYKFISTINYSSFLFFILGVLSLVSFAILQIS